MRLPADHFGNFARRDRRRRHARHADGRSRLGPREPGGGALAHAVLGEHRGLRRRGRRAERVGPRERPPDGRARGRRARARGGGRPHALHDAVDPADDRAPPRSRRRSASTTPRRRRWRTSSTTARTSRPSRRSSPTCSARRSSPCRRRSPASTRRSRGTTRPGGQAATAGFDFDHVDAAPAEAMNRVLYCGLVDDRGCATEKREMASEGEEGDDPIPTHPPRVPLRPPPIPAFPPQERGEGDPAQRRWRVRRWSDKGGGDTSQGFSQQVPVVRSAQHGHLPPAPAGGRPGWGAGEADADRIAMRYFPCPAKNAQMIPDASGPSGSVKLPAVLPPLQSWASPVTDVVLEERRAARSAGVRRVGEALAARAALRALRGADGRAGAGVRLGPLGDDLRAVDGGDRRVARPLEDDDRHRARLRAHRGEGGVALRRRAGSARCGGGERRALVGPRLVLEARGARRWRRRRPGTSRRG